MNYRVTETIHHGDYYNVQVSDGETIAYAFTEALRTSPYNFTVAADVEANEHAMRCLMGLLESGKGDFGWARYVVEASS